MGQLLKITSNSGQPLKGQLILGSCTAPSIGGPVDAVREGHDHSCSFRREYNSVRKLYLFTLPKNRNCAPLQRSRTHDQHHKWI